MKLITISSIFFALAMTSSAAIKMAPEATVEDIMVSLHTEGEGFLHLAGDGVLRSYDRDGTTVLDYMALTATQIQSHIGGYQGAEGAHYAEVFNGVDPTVGERADEEQMWKPSPQNQPPEEGEEWNAAMSSSANVLPEDDLFERRGQCGPRLCHNQNQCAWLGCHQCLGNAQALKKCWR